MCTLPPLYKYLDLKGALLTLANKTFKHAKPSDFNDTEDLTLQSLFPEELEVALKNAQNRFIDVILRHLNEVPTCNSPLRAAIGYIQHLFRNDPEAANLVKAEMLSDGAPPIFDIDHMRSISEEVIQQINAMMQATRILCVTTQINSEKMWTQYAENHEGIALRIEPSLEKDSKFQRFRPVSYREKRPPLFESADEFIAGAFWGNREARLREKNDKIICTKTLNWAHEREYRSAIPLRKNEEPWDTVLITPKR
jgi:hypothetical protein